MLKVRHRLRCEYGSPDVFNKATLATQYGGSQSSTKKKYIRPAPANLQ